MLICCRIQIVQNLIEDRGNLVGCTLRSSKSFCAQIKFGDQNLVLDLEGVVPLVAWKQKGSIVLDPWWKIAGNSKLVCCPNRAGKFIFCAMKMVEAKDLTYIFRKELSYLEGGQCS